MIDTILLDLDGTLLCMDTDVFTDKYFEQLAVKLKDYFTQEELTSILWTSIKHMVMSTDKNQTNEEAFYEKFYQTVNYEKQVLQPLIDEYYEKDFHKLEHICERNNYVIDSIDLLKSKNYKLVVATNPLFPKLAVIDRIRWAGLDKDDFSFVTSFETMNFCKPNINFYKQVLEVINKDSSQCLMVGNHGEEDMIAKEIGISTYLIEDFAMGNIENNKNIDHSGNYKDFYDFVKDLPKISKTNTQS